MPVSIIFFSSTISEYPTNVHLSIYLSNYPSPTLLVGTFIGEFEPRKAGTRMRVPIPLTWETLISSSVRKTLTKDAIPTGNTAEMWEYLMDHDKLPFMGKNTVF